jgi:integrase
LGKSNRLTAKFVDQIKSKGTYRDGSGLLLRVEPSGAKRWVLRITVGGRRRDIGLGSGREVSLREAREQAYDLRRVARSGQDPTAYRRTHGAEMMSFRAASEAVHQKRCELWQNRKHGDQWISTLRTYAFPVIGDLAVGMVEAAHVLRVLEPIWLAKPETARRVRQRIRTVLDWAVAAGHRSSLSVNAADAVPSGLSRQPRNRKHHPAVPWQDIPAFVIQVQTANCGLAVKLALEFLLLTAARTVETIGARWNEIDLAAATWTVPATRMKSRREHRVPLSESALRILRECRLRWPNSDFVFPGRDEHQPLSDMALLMCMRRLGLTSVPHGLRSSFRDWAADTRQDRDLAEAALAHALPSQTEAAYRRSDLFEAKPRAAIGSTGLPP